ncbi:MAG: peptidase [Spirochaetaceae bacterium]|nr:MAG: peptidase [Spirochaetaceae bacterium]
MSFCLGIKVIDGLVAIADTRITTGSERITARKLSVFREGDCQFFMMTSGLRSVRDKVLTYYGELQEAAVEPADRLFKVVNRLSELIRRVANEDKTYLEQSGLSFNSHAIVGGRLRADATHKLFLIYPQGNWIEVGEGSPYQIIGTAHYGKPVIDRVLTYQDSLRTALKVGVLAFDSTRISAADVGFPIDVALYRRDTFSIVEHRYDAEDLADITSWWQEKLRDLVRALPDHWLDAAFSRIGGSAAAPVS